jgi:hypothetical protein
VAPGVNVDKTPYMLSVEMLYIGDALFEGGNDEPVIATDIQTKPVVSPLETSEVVRHLQNDLLC